MPLFADGLKKIRKGLERAAAKQWMPYEKIGFFAPEQLLDLNAMRQKAGRPPMSATIVCDGKHLYDSRCVKDGYSIDEVIEQTEVAFQTATEFHSSGWATTLKSATDRAIEDGHKVRDELVFECSSKHPKAALISVIPRGDGRGPASKRKPLEEGLSPKT